MLNLEKQAGQFQNLNLRPEKHGDENVPGADLKISITVPNDTLAEFHPSLKSFLFRDTDPELDDLADRATEGPRLRFGRKMDVLRWKHEIVGAHLTIHYGTDSKESNVVLDDVTVDHFQIEPMDGGSVVLTFRVKCNPDEKAVGKLSTLMGGEIEFSLVPPEEGGVFKEAA